MSTRRKVTAEEWMAIITLFITSTQSVGNCPHKLTEIALGGSVSDGKLVIFHDIG